jgi:hypothetical protein
VTIFNPDSVLVPNGAQPTPVPAADGSADNPYPPPAIGEATIRPVENKVDADEAQVEPDQDNNASLSDGPDATLAG